MSSLVIIGAQWGDEGKGKLVDYFTSNADWSVRFNGGNNAGHTIVYDDKTVKLSLTPSGILRPGCKCLIGAGLVVNAGVLEAEMQQLRSVGVEINPDRLLLDRNAQLILPHHIAIDQQRELSKGKAKIGTTGRGIGPAYEDRAARCGVKLAELQYMDSLEEKIRGLVEQSNTYLRAVIGSSLSLKFSEVWEELTHHAEILLPFIGNGSKVIDEALRSGSRVVFEGAQGTLLDLVFGTVPYVTSSHTLSSCVGTGCGIGGHRISYVLGVAKAYCTRVGSGPFPTELYDETGERIRSVGAEFGTVTGRPRRCGWCDAAALRYAVRVNGIDSLAITKLDVLSGLETIKVGVGYRLKGKTLDDFPALSSEMEEMEVLYEEFPGWDEDLSKVESWDSLPLRARSYVEALEDLVGCKISVLSVAADRKATLFHGEHDLLRGFMR